MDKAPRRRNQLTISIGADSWQDVLYLLNDFVADIEARSDEAFTLVHGGNSTGGTVEATVNPEMTHENYMAALHTYLEER